MPLYFELEARNPLGIDRQTGGRTGRLARRVVRSIRTAAQNGSTVIYLAYSTYIIAVRRKLR